MAYTTINKSTEYFNTKLYTGNGSTQSITGVGFQPDWTWIKKRNATRNHNLFDSVRGVQKALHTDANSAEATSANYLTAFGTDGFSVGSSSNVNANSDTYVAWNWKAGTTGSGTTTGSGYGKAYSYSVNTTAGFSVITYKGNGTAGHTIPHHLGATPSFIIVKNRDAAQSWLVGTTVLGWTKNLHLNETGSVETTTNIWNDTAPTSTVFTVGTNTKCNTDDEDYIAYVFVEKTGYSKFGSYYGNGSSDGAFVYTGFRPEFTLIKPSSATQNWQIHDTKRDGYNVKNDNLAPNNTAAEADNQFMDILSNGFKLRSSTYSASSTTYIYMAFGQTLVGSNNVPNNAR